MGERPYDSLATVYAWLMPDELVEPEGAAAAFAGLTDTLPPGARVLDCAAGTGHVAVGLALRGFEVTATDASGAMVDATRALAADRGVRLRAERRTWEQLSGGFGTFDAVLCVGNSLTHAAGRARRRAALAAMAGVLGDGGLLVVTSRNWERVRAAGSGLEVADRLVRRGGRAGLAIRAWTIPDDWDAPHRLDVAVAFPEGDGVETVAESLAFWPFRRGQLDEDLRAAGLRRELSTYEADAERYLVTARRSSAGAGAG